MHWSIYHTTGSLWCSVVDIYNAASEGTDIPVYRCFCNGLQNQDYVSTEKLF